MIYAFSSPPDNLAELFEHAETCENVLREAKLGRFKHVPDDDAESARKCLEAACEVMEDEIYEIRRRNTEEYWTDKAKDETVDHYRKQIFHQLEQLQEAGSRVSSNRPKKRDRSVLDFSFDETE